MNQRIRAINFPDPIEVFIGIIMGLLCLLALAIIVLLSAAMWDVAHQPAPPPPELTTSDGSVPPSIITDQTTGCQYLRSEWGHTTPRLGKDGHQICGEGQ